MARRVEVTRRILEISDPAELRAPARPPLAPFELVAVHDPKLNRELYETVGGPYSLDRPPQLDRHRLAALGGAGRDHG